MDAEETVIAGGPGPQDAPSEPPEPTRRRTSWLSRISVALAVVVAAVAIAGFVIRVP